MDCPDAKKPCKGILKTSSSFDKTGASYRKSAKFDELNVLQTLHPADKDYGHMKIEEPKTPYNFMDPNDSSVDQLDAELLAEKLRIAANTQTPAFGADDDPSDEEFSETDEEKARRIEFERRRKMHYNEYEAVRLARKLIQEELSDDEDELLTLDDETLGKKSEIGLQLPEEEEDQNAIDDKTPTASSKSSNTNVDRPMDVDAGPPMACYGVDDATNIE